MAGGGDQRAGLHPLAAGEITPRRQQVALRRHRHALALKPHMAVDHRILQLATLALNPGRYAASGHLRQLMDKGIAMGEGHQMRQGDHVAAAALGQERCRPLERHANGEAAQTLAHLGNLAQRGAALGQGRKIPFTEVAIH